MTIRNFWRLFLKGLGVWIIISSISVGMNYLATIIPGYSGWSDYSMFAILFLLIFSLGIFYLIIHFFLFKTEWLIDRFKLDQGFDDERIDIAISTQTFIAIIISVLGGIYFIDSVPSLCKALYNFYQQSFVFRQSPKSNSIVFYLVESVLGYILLMNGSFLSNKLLGKLNSESSVISEEESNSEL